MNSGTVISDYIIDHAIGEGGMGTVYLARHNLLAQQVAIKVLDPEVARKPGIKERFIQEANIQAMLKHPNIVQVLTATRTESGTPALVMEYILGKSLSDVLAVRGALPIDDALKVMGQILSAVGYAHAQGVIHRDLKPSNIMVMANGEVKVTDFGIAKLLGSSRLTRTGTAMGSAHYMSPEQIRRPEMVDVRSDIYSLGCVLYEMLTGRPPFGEEAASGTESDFDIKEGHIHEAAPAPHTLREDLPGWLDNLVIRMLEKSPEQRPSSCEKISVEIRKNTDIIIDDPPHRLGQNNLNLPSSFNFIKKITRRNDINSTSTEKNIWQKKSGIFFRLLLPLIFVIPVGIYFFSNSIQSLYKDVVDSIVTENTGKFVIHPQFDEASNFSEGLAAVRIGDIDTGKYGFIDKQGRMVISPQFEYASSFSEGLASVRIGDSETGKYGFINKKGEMVIPPQFDDAFSFYEGFAVIRSGDWDTGKYGFINNKGKIIVAPQFDEATNFSDGMALVRVGDEITGQYGFINHEGKLTIPTQFSLAFDFLEGLASVRLSGNGSDKYGFINKDGKFVISAQFDFALPFLESLAVIRVGDDENGKYGFIDKDGKIVIPARFDGIVPFFEGLARIQSDDGESSKFGFINKKGEIVVPAQFDDAGVFSEGLACVLVGDPDTGKYGFIDKNGKMVVKPQFDLDGSCFSHSFSEGFSVVIDKKTGKKGFIARR